MFFFFFFFFFNDTATTEIYTLSLHDALPICPDCTAPAIWGARPDRLGTALSMLMTSSRTLFENREPRSAMPVAMPTCRNVELMPEAMPARCGCTTPTAVDASGGFTRPTARPPTIMPGIRCVQDE